MINENSANKRLIKNTLLLYFRMFLSMAMSLYLSRITLSYLGINNYGIYNVVGGVVMLITVVSSAFTSSSQRFLSISLGKDDINGVNRCFLTIQNIHILLAVIFFILAEACSVWMIEDYLTIPKERISAAYVVFHLSVLTTLLTLLNVPYQALLIASEKFSAFAYIGIIEQASKLVAILILVHLSGDHLIRYATLLFVLSLSIRLVYAVYARKNFRQITAYRLFIDKEKFNEIWRYVSWAYLGNFSGIAKEHGINIVIGHFFGVAINAARGVSMQVYNAIFQFGNNFVAALHPQITKCYASQDYDRAIKLVVKGTKFTFILMYVIAVPILIRLNQLLAIWLKEVPEHTLIFCRLIIALCIVRTIQDPINTLYLAIGKIKKSQIFAAINTVICLLFCALLFYVGLPPESSVFLSLLLEVFNILVTCHLLAELIKIDWGSFFKNGVVPIGKVVIISLPANLFFYWMSGTGIVCTLLICAIVFVVNVSIVFLCGLDKNEKKYIVVLFNEKLRKLQ